MSLYFGWFMVCVLLGLGGLEWVKFLRSDPHDEEMPYPRRRLSRRLAIAIVFSVLVLATLYFPDTATLMAKTSWMGGILFGIVLGLLLVWRDLKETSQSVVAANARFQAEASQSMEDFLREQIREARDNQANSVDCDGADAKKT